MKNREHETRWNRVKSGMVGEDILLGHHFSTLLRESPEKIIAYLSLYKFAAKMIGEKRRVLDIGCQEGFGSWLLAFECGFCKGIDPDQQAIESAKQNFHAAHVSFESKDFFFHKSQAKWDAVVAFNELTTIKPDKVDKFMEKIVDSLTVNGILIIGASNKENLTGESQGMRGTASYSFEEFHHLISKWFEHKFFFSVAGENILPHFNNTSDHFIALGCKKSFSE